MVLNVTVKMQGEDFYFASLDGEDFLPVSRPVADTDEDRADLAKLFEGDGNFRPMRFGRRFFEYQMPDTEVVWAD